MQENQTSQNPSLNTGWRMLAERILTIQADGVDAFREWLDDVLRSLDLSADFREKILRSALEAAGRAKAAGDGNPVHLSLFVPAEYSRQAQSWGFFRVEMIENAEEEPVTRKHAVEFYLYREGG
jgi:hypothetical protein